jgi:hypothetical protein
MPTLDGSKYKDDDQVPLRLWYALDGKGKAPNWAALERRAAIENRKRQEQVDKRAAAKAERKAAKARLELAKEEVARVKKEFNAKYGNPFSLVASRLIRHRSPPPADSAPEVNGEEGDTNQSNTTEPQT